MTIYFATMIAVAGGFNLGIAHRSRACALHLRCFSAAACAAVAQRRLMRVRLTGRVTEPHTNIATVKLFSQAIANPDMLKTAMQEIRDHGPIANGAARSPVLKSSIRPLSVLLVSSTTGVTLWFFVDAPDWAWVVAGHGDASSGSTVSHALDRSVEFAALFERAMGTVKDGITGSNAGSP